MSKPLSAATRRAALICAITGALVALDPYAIGSYRHLAPQGRWATALAQLLTDALELHLVVVGILLYVALVRSERLRRLVVLGGASVAQTLLVTWLNDLADRPRPADLSAALTLGAQGDIGGRSFPSGHAASAFALATVLSAWYPRQRWVFYTLAGLVVWSRIHLNRHFTADCFMGGCLGYYVAQCFLLYVWQQGSPLNRAEKDEAMR